MPEHDEVGIESTQEWASARGTRAVLRPGYEKQYPALRPKRVHDLGE